MKEHIEKLKELVEAYKKYSEALLDGFNNDMGGVTYPSVLKDDICRLQLQLEELPSSRHQENGKQETNRELLIRFMEMREGHHVDTNDINLIDEYLKQAVNPEPVTDKCVKNCYSPCKEIKFGKVKFTFGDRVLNHYASENNPIRIGVVYVCTGDVVKCTDMKGHYWQFSNNSELKLEKIGSILNQYVKQSVSDEERRLKILEEVKIGFDICSDMSTFCLGYRNLVKEIEELKDKLTIK